VNRRKFLNFLGIAPIVAKILPFLPNVPVATASYQDFLTVSELIDQTAIDPIVEATALELGRRAGLTMDALWAQAFSEDA
jgi:hypothetical protein